MNTALLSVFGSCIAVIIPLLSVCVIIKEKSSRRILLYFCWGTFAGLLAFIINNFLTISQDEGSRLQTVIAPMTEEFIKGLPLLLFLSRKKHPQITVSIVYCAFAAGVGFSIQESLFHFTHSSGSAGHLITLTVRTLTTSIMHGVTTAIIGAGLMMIQSQRHIILPLIFGLFAISISVHAIFNLLLPSNLAIIAVLMPVGLYFVGMALIRSNNTITNI